MVDPVLRAAVARLAEPTRTLVGYHFGWWDEHGTGAAVSAGKMVRPSLTLLCAEAVGAPPEWAVSGAAAVELVHNFSLLHDDIIDGDRTRRHRPTAWSVFGVPAAILAGDALLALAIEVLADRGSAPALTLLGDSLVTLANGQTADVAFEVRNDVGRDECIAMAADKTAALLGCACALGAVLGGADASRAERLRLFGHHVGLAFQWVDDLLGIWGDPAVTGKPLRSDLRTRKKSLPVIAALCAGNDAARRLAELYRRPEPLTEEELDVATVLIEATGGRAWAQREAERHLDLATACLREARPAPQPAERLVTLAALITQRDH